MITRTLEYALSIAVALACLVFATPATGQEAKPPADAGVVRVESNGNTFHWPYLLFVPAKLRAGDPAVVRTMMVLPNNTGTADDDLAVHEKAAVRMMGNLRPAVDQMGVAILQPIFPRPKSDWRMYTHALDRDTILCDKAALKRLDQQLIAMIDHARERLAKEGLTIDPRVLVFGFSASGMFANRFTFLQPDRVKAAAIGSPGGWPLAPVAMENGRTLRYPIGVGDIAHVTGQQLNWKRLAEVPLFFFMGDNDANDSVIFRDSYDEEDEKLIGQLFGKTPVERWPAAERLYRSVLPKAKFKLYAGIEHKLTPEMQKDVTAFFLQHIQTVPMPVR